MPWSHFLTLSAIVAAAAFHRFGVDGFAIPVAIYLLMPYRNNR